MNSNMMQYLSLFLDHCLHFKAKKFEVFFFREYEIHVAPLNFGPLKSQGRAVGDGEIHSV